MLHLQQQAAGGGGTGKILRMVGDWGNELSVTWNSVQLLGTPASTGVGISIPGSAGERTFTLTTVVSEWHTGANANHGLLFRLSSGTGGMRFANRHGATPPRLVVDYGPCRGLRQTDGLALQPGRFVWDEWRGRQGLTRSGRRGRGFPRRVR